MDNHKKPHKTSIGGQALIEGVMMRGPSTTAMSVRKSDGSIITESWETGGEKKPWYKKTPFVRGIFNFIDMMLFGYRCLMRSADLAEIEEDPSPFEKRLMKLFGDKFESVFTGLALVIALLFAVGLFMILPTLIASFLGRFITHRFVLTLLEGCLKISIFVLYLAAVSRSKDIRRVFEYHGAEHKTIACYEAGLPLTPENAINFTRFHPRCGTSFILIVLVVSIMLFSVVSWDSLLMRLALKLLLLPLVVGIAYEIIRIAGHYDNALTRAISAPGIWLQRFTTYEPDASQLEVAIASMLPCIPLAEGEDRW